MCVEFCTSTDSNGKGYMVLDFLLKTLIRTVSVLLIKKCAKKNPVLSEVEGCGIFHWENKFE